MSQPADSPGDAGLLLSAGQLHPGEWKRSGPGRRPMHGGPAETVPTLLVWPSQGRGSGPREGVFLEKCVLGHPSALAY